MVKKQPHWLSDKFAQDCLKQDVSRHFSDGKMCIGKNRGSPRVMQMISQHAMKFYIAKPWFRDETYYSKKNPKVQSKQNGVHKNTAGNRGKGK